MKKLAIIVVSAMTALTSMVPAHAFPVASGQKTIEAPQSAAEVQQVQWRERDRWEGRRYYRHNRDYRRGDYYRGRHYRGNNTGAIIGGLAAGALIGGAIASQPRYAEPRYVQPRRYVNAGSAHVNWCANRYRSYRAYDNSFQPYNGPRQLCYSPY